MLRVRQTAVAGTFYPSDAQTLSALVHQYLAQAKPETADLHPKALIVPHAGYVYSGPIAGSAYAALRAQAEVIRRVVLIGPAHTAPLTGLAVSSVDAFRTPLGRVPVDRDAVRALLSLPQVQQLDHAHTTEHGLEVQLPFLQTVLGQFHMVPLVVGMAQPADVAAVLAQLWDGPETLIVISSDLSHYHDYAAAQRLDEETAVAIESLAPGQIGRDQACGRVAIQGLLLLAQQHGLRAQTLDLRNSGDTAGPRNRVVGYGAFAFLPSG